MSAKHKCGMREGGGFRLVGDTLTGKSCGADRPKVHGLFCSNVRRVVPTIRCGWFDLNWPKVSPNVTTWGCGNVWRTFCTSVAIGVTTKKVASMPLAMGGLGFRDGVRISPTAFWASWADSLGMIKARHLQVADTITQGLNGEAAAPTSRAAASARHNLIGVQGFEPPSWETLANGVRSVTVGSMKLLLLEKEFRELHLMPHLAGHEKALVRSQSGLFAGMAFSSAPSSHLQRIDSHLFRVLLLRRLRLPLPLSARSCR